LRAPSDACLCSLTRENGRPGRSDPAPAPLKKVQAGALEFTLAHCDVQRLRAHWRVVRTVARVWCELPSLFSPSFLMLRACAGILVLPCVTVLPFCLLWHLRSLQSLRYLSHSVFLAAWQPGIEKVVCRKDSRWSTLIHGSVHLSVRGGSDSGRAVREVQCSSIYRLD